MIRVCQRARENRISPELTRSLYDLRANAKPHSSVYLTCGADDTESVSRVHTLCCAQLKAKTGMIVGESRLSPCTNASHASRATRLDRRRVSTSYPNYRIHSPSWPTVSINMSLGRALELRGAVLLKTQTGVKKEMDARTIINSPL